MPLHARRRKGLDVTVLIATRDRADPLSRTLTGLAAQQLDGLSWEVIVVDNGSSDHTRSVLAFAAGSLPLILLEEPRPGKNRALNRGLAEARGDLVVFTDDDVAPPSDWIGALVAATTRWPEENIFGGAVVPRFPDGTPDWMMAPEFPHPKWAFSLYHPRNGEGPTSDPPVGPNYAIRSRLLVDTRFDESMGPKGSNYAMGDETELLLRLWRRGEQFIFVPDAPVEHVLADDHVTKRTLTTRAFRCGRGHARLSPSGGSFPVFGIPIYHWQRGVKATVRLATAAFHSQRDRWIAAMEFHQVRGNITERIALRREARRSGAERQPLFPAWAAITAATKRRGLWSILSAPITRLLRPVVRLNRWHLFESRLDAVVDHRGADDGWQTRVFQGVESGRAARVALCRLGQLGPAEIEDRLRHGHTVAVAYVEGEPIAYAWCAYSTVAVTELGGTLHIGATEIAGYDGYVVHAWRGRRVLAALDSAHMAMAVEVGRTRQFVYADARNRALRRALEAMGKERVLTLYRLSSPLLGRDIEWSRGDDSKSRFGASARGSGTLAAPGSVPPSAVG